MSSRFKVYLECGAKRTFAGALDWPGWCRHGRSEAEAIAALCAYGPRYAAILAGTRLGFVPPKSPGHLGVVERLRGTATTDFGAIGVPPSVDHERSCSAGEIKRFEAILRAGWRAFDAAVEAARGKRLATGPRGGGRALAAIVEHVRGADAGYLSAAGVKAPKVQGPGQLHALREAILAAVRDSATGKIPAEGSRGGVRWTARFFVRRVAWHVISHAWEIERRAGISPG